MSNTRYFVRLPTATERSIMGYSCPTWVVDAQESQTAFGQPVDAYFVAYHVYRLEMPGPVIVQRSDNHRPIRVCANFTEMIEWFRTKAGGVSYHSELTSHLPTQPHAPSNPVVREFLRRDKAPPSAPSSAHSNHTPPPSSPQARARTSGSPADTAGTSSKSGSAGAIPPG